VYQDKEKKKKKKGPAADGKKLIHFMWTMGSLGLVLQGPFCSFKKKTCLCFLDPPNQTGPLKG